MKTITLPEFLTEDEIQTVLDLWKGWSRYSHPIGKSYAKTVCEEVIRPNLERINKALGQENDPMYLAYAVEFVMRNAGKNP